MNARNGAQDFFISYRSADKAWAEWIAWVLEDAGYTVFVQAWDFRPGQNFVHQMQQAASSCRRTIAVLTPAYLESGFTRAEWYSAFAKDPTGKESLLLPVRVQECDIDGLLGQIIYIDLVGLDETQAPERLLAGIEGARVKPTTRPIFPGPFPRHVADQPQPPFPGALSPNPPVNVPRHPHMQQTLAIGVDVGTTKIAAGLVDIPATGDPTVKHYKRVDHHDIGRDKQLLQKIEGVISDVMIDAGIGKRDLAHVGVGLPGQVNYSTGYMIFAPGLNLRNVSVVGDLYERLGIPVHIDNDVHCSTLAELRFGKAGKDYKDFVCIFIGTGIGAGIVINKQLLRGHSFSAGEIGHMKIDCSEGARDCTCGGKGCFEEYASARAIIRLAREKIYEVRDRVQSSYLSSLSPDNVRPEDIVEAINRKDELSIVLAKHVANYLAIGIANIINMLNPQAVVLGGGIVEGFYRRSDLFRNAVSEGIRKSVLDVCCNTGILTSSFRENTPIIGAALLGKC